MPVKYWLKACRQWLILRQLPQAGRPAGISVAPRSTAYDICIFAVINWDELFQRPQQLAVQFARHGYRVFYIKPSFLPPLLGADSSGSSVRQVAEGVIEIQLSCPQMLIANHARLDAPSVQTLCNQIAALRHEWDIDGVCLVELPFWKPLAFALREQFGWPVIYDCMDEYAGFTTNKPAMLAEEALLSSHSDIVLVTAQRLLEKHRQYHPVPLLVPNAADFAHFSQLCVEPPVALQSLSRPIIGYVGTIGDWFDMRLVSELARQRPGWSFVLLGPVIDADLVPILALANVHLLGAHSYASLPAYLQSFDVGLIPFRRTPLTEATHPVKFYEYLSAGKPVVSIPLPELVPYAPQGLVCLATDAAEFVEHIEHALAENTTERQAQRRAFARAHSWEARFCQIQAAIDALPSPRYRERALRDVFVLGKKVKPRV